MRFPVFLFQDNSAQVESRWRSIKKDLQCFILFLKDIIPMLFLLIVLLVLQKMRSTSLDAIFLCPTCYRKEVLFFSLFYCQTIVFVIKM